MASVRSRSARTNSVTINTNGWNRLRYTIYAPFYDAVAPFRRQRRRSIGLLDLEPGERLLIDGAGTGADLDHIPAGVQVTATDLTPAMVERIASRSRSLGRSVDARVMDAHALELPDASFDAVILHLIIAVVPDPSRAIREAARVLRPGGRAVIFDKFAPDEGRLSLRRRALNLVANTLFTDVTRRLPPLLHDAGLTLVHREAAVAGGLFEIALVRKEG